MVNSGETPRLAFNAQKLTAVQIALMTKCNMSLAVFKKRILIILQKLNEGRYQSHKIKSRQNLVKITLFDVIDGFNSNVC